MARRFYGRLPAHVAEAHRWPPGDLFTAPLSTSPACHAHGGHGHAGARGEAEKHRITWVGVGINVVLSACKLFAGVVGNSAAMPVNAISPAVSRRGL